MEFLTEVVTVFDPSVELNPVGGLVADLDEASLQVIRPGCKVDEFVTADPGIGRDAIGPRVLSRVGSVCSMEGACENRMACHVLAPVIESYPPGIDNSRE